MTNGENNQSLAERVQRLQDRNDIQETLYRYCRFADRADIDEMTALFTEDCRVNYVPGNEELMFHGREALHSFLSAHQGNVRSGSHHISNVELIFGTTDAVTAHTYMYSWQRFADYPATEDCHRWGRYEMRLERSHGAWRFSQLRLYSAGEYGGDRIGEHFGRPWPPVFG